MAKYKVLIEEVYLQEVNVDANSPEEAANTVREGGGSYGKSTYQHTNDIKEVKNMETNLVQEVKE